jgi:hypothetical protein
VQTGSVDIDDLRYVCGLDTEDTVARGLRFVGGDAYLLAQNAVK